MKTFHCDVCDNLVYFENVRCESCGHELAFVPALGSVTAIAAGDAGLWRRALPAGKAVPADAPQYRKCRNYEQESACNWAMDADDPGPYCISCRLTETIPDLSQPGNREAWVKLETAKRRLICSLLELKLPVQGKAVVPEGLLFRFMADDPQAPGAEGKVLTGHDDGTIVINIAEADDAERERRRLQMHEPYRTLLGHLRHEIGHYYWDVLIRDSARLEAYRQLFGNERADYMESLQRHYQTGGPPDWRERFVSVYATSHPWEDWAETWAHYMHISDTLETADVSGLALRPRHRNEPKLAPVPAPSNPAARDFDEMIERWLSLTYLLNNLNRGLGLGDAYPFVLSAPALDKLRFVHETICPAQ
jgi:hypothetical protein